MVWLTQGSALGQVVKGEGKSESSTEIGSNQGSSISCPKPPTFWEQYRRKPQGMLGLAIVVVYVLVAVFAPVIAPYDPMSDLYLADSIAAPAWLSKFGGKYHGLPPTIRFSLDHSKWDTTPAEGVAVSPWQHGEDTGIEVFIPVTEQGESEKAEAAETATSPWMSSFQWDPFGSSGTEETPGAASAEEPQESTQDSVVFEHAFNYEYKRPRTFSASFQYGIDAPSDAETCIELELVTPSGKTFSLWDTKANGSDRIWQESGRCAGS